MTMWSIINNNPNNLISCSHKISGYKILLSSIKVGKRFNYPIFAMQDEYIRKKGKKKKNAMKCRLSMINLGNRISFIVMWKGCFNDIDPWTSVVSCLSQKGLGRWCGEASRSN